MELHDRVRVLMALSKVCMRFRMERIGSQTDEQHRNEVQKFWKLQNTILGEVWRLTEPDQRKDYLFDLEHKFIEFCRTSEADKTGLMLAWSTMCKMRA